MGRQKYLGNMIWHCGTCTVWSFDFKSIYLNR